MDAVIEDRMDVDEDVLNRIREIYTAMEAERKRLGQKDVDSLLGELGL